MDFPFLLNGAISVGGVTVDEACNLYVAMQQNNVGGGSVYRVTYPTGQVTQIAELSRLTRGVVYNPTDSNLYVTSLDRLVAMATDGSNSHELAGSIAGQYLNGIALAPEGFGEYGGHLIVAQNTGSILAFDPTNAVPQVVQTLAPFVSDVAFGGDHLYATAYLDKQIVEVTADGMVNLVATLTCEPDGVTVDPGGRVFAACGREGLVYSISLASGDIVQVASAELNPGWAPTGVLFDAGAVLLIEEDTGLRAFFP